MAWSTRVAGEPSGLKMDVVTGLPARTIVVSRPSVSKPKVRASVVVAEPFSATETAGKFDVRVSVRGGGPSGQAGAVRHGISRALIKADATYRPNLKTEGLLTRDPRMKERKKYGQPGARKRFQFSKR